MMIPIEVWQYRMGKREVLHRKEMTVEEAIAFVESLRGEKGKGLVVDIATGDPFWRYNLLLLPPEHLVIMLEGQCTSE